MPDEVAPWLIHWSEAWGSFDHWRARVEAEIDAARSSIAAVLPLPPMNIRVERGPYGVIPETGLGGRAHGVRGFTLRLDPENSQFAGSLADGLVQRIVAHEAHHCLRMAGPGYGRRLGEALVSEGLAGRFVSHVFGCPPEPWERAVDAAALDAFWPDEETLWVQPYDHAAWFFGKSGRPRWLGYSLGYEIVGRWLAGVKGRGVKWVSIPAETVMASAIGPVR